MPFAKRAALALCLCLALLLTACDPAQVAEAFRPVGTDRTVAPDLRLLTRPPYTEAFQAPAAEDTEAPLRVDLWLDASQVMGGINPSVQSMYPHFSRKYREGGFHYRFQNTVGWYESVLRCLLASAEGSRVRLLRCGNERLPDAFLKATGVADAAEDADALRSLRRDMLTCAIDPMPSLLSRLSNEDMTDSFYAPASPWLAGVGSLNRALLENPAKQSVMQNALTQQREAILANENPSLLALQNDGDYPLLYALNNLDLNRLSVITCDPAAIRRLSDVRVDGSPIRRVEETLRGRGVFDAGLSVGLYAFTLDYMGQLASFGPADFSEPILWGRLNYSDRTHTSTDALVMPRTLLMLVIGKPEQLSAYTKTLDMQLAAEPSLQAARGPEKGELTYTQNGQTIVQQPFAFESRYAAFSRPQVACSTQHTQGAFLTAQRGSTSTQEGLTTITLSPDESLSLADDSFTLALPDAADPARLTNITLQVQTALLWDRTLPARDAHEPAHDEQHIALRDKVYVFRTVDHPFDARPDDVPFNVASVTQTAEGLAFMVTADSAKLKPGYYRVCLSADFSGRAMNWPAIPWLSEVNADLTNAQISVWEEFTRLITRYDSKRELVPKQFQHAWGGAAAREYHGMPVPDLPPVMRAPGLAELVSQIQSAANVDTVPFVRYVFDVFVTGGPMPAARP